MKRMTIIAAALCLIMLTTVGAGAVAAKQENPRQAGASSIYFLDVAATGSHGAGKLMIDAKQGTFVFNGKGFTPDTLYALQYRAASSGIYVLASQKSTSSGNLHIAGTWTKNAVLPSAPALTVTALTDILAEQLHVKALPPLNNGVIYENGWGLQPPQQPYVFWATGGFVHYKLTTWTGEVRYEGPNANLNYDPRAANSTVSYTGYQQNALYELDTWDSAGTEYRSYLTLPYELG